MGHCHTVEYYLAIKRNEVLTYATAYVNPENTLGEILKDKKS